MYNMKTKKLHKNLKSILKNYIKLNLKNNNIKVGQIIKIESDNNKKLNRNYKITFMYISKKHFKFEKLKRYAYYKEGIVTIDYDLLSKLIKSIPTFKN